jgi:hypothetical protein
MLDILFTLQGGPWDGQTIDSDDACEVTADFARVLYTLTRGAAVGQQLQLAPPSESEHSDDSDEADEANSAGPHHRPHVYAITQRRQSQGKIFATAVHVGV